MQLTPILQSSVIDREHLKSVRPSILTGFSEDAAECAVPAPVRVPDASGRIPEASGRVPDTPVRLSGGEGATTRCQYDREMSHLYLTQHQGVTKIVVFGKDQSPLLYSLPFECGGMADLVRPDFNRFPTLRHLQGWECTLRVGETLYIPPGYWYQIGYVTSGSLSSRRVPSVLLSHRFARWSHTLAIEKIDRLFGKLWGSRWHDMKVTAAETRAERVLAAYEYPDDPYLPFRRSYAGEYIPD
jgi:hypothetical protein